MLRKPEFKTVDIKLEISLMEGDYAKFIEKLEKEGKIEALTPRRYISSSEEDYIRYEK